MLTEIEDCELSGEASNGEEALQLCQQQAPDVLLLDVRMPGLSGIDVAQHLNALDEPPATKDESLSGLIKRARATIKREESLLRRREQLSQK